MKTFHVELKIDVDDEWLKKFGDPEVAVSNEVMYLLEKPHFTPDCDIDVMEEVEDTEEDEIIGLT